MKRVLFSITVTVVGLVALLGFKTHNQVSTVGGALPSVGAPAGSSSSTTSSSAATSSAAPPNPTPSTAAPATPATTPSSAPPKPVPKTTAPKTAAAAPSPASTTFIGAAERTRYGIVQVKITVAGKKLTNVAFVQLTAFDGRSQQINSGAAPILLQETMRAQSANIDSVSGASYTSQGYEQSLQSALDKAGV